MDSNFWKLAGAALIVFAFVAPLAYCTSTAGGPTTINDLVLECIKQRGEWHQGEGFGGVPRCVFPKASLTQKGTQE